MNLWTAIQLLMKGWIMRGEETLGMAVVNEERSPLNGTVPVPRVLQNQLDHKLEQEVIKTEHKLLKELQRVMRRRNRHQWIVVFVAVVIVLHVLERDTWRLLYWVHRPEQVCCLYILMETFALMALDLRLATSFPTHHVNRQECLLQQITTGTLPLHIRRDDSHESRLD